MINPVRLQRLLSTQYCGRHLIQLCTVDSTNRILLNWSHPGAAELPPLPLGTALIATRQQAGKGQYGRSWHSPAGGLYLSLLLYPETPADQILPLTLTLVWGVVDQLRTQLALPIQVKWPNDLIYQGRKLGGLLLQSRSQGAQIRVGVAGLGLNINTPISAAGICLAEARGEPLDRAQVAAWVLLGLEQGYQIWQGSGLTGILDCYQQWMSHLHHQVQLPDQTPAMVLGVAPTGELQVKTPQGEQQLAPGQIRLGYAAPLDLASESPECSVSLE